MIELIHLVCESDIYIIVGRFYVTFGRNRLETAGTCGVVL